jgi:FtsH-binding integral membrane protein
MIDNPSYTGTGSVSGDDTHVLFGQTMGYVAVTAGFFALGSYAGRHLSGGWALVWFIAAFACLIGMNFTVRRDLSGLARASFWALIALIAFGIVMIFVNIPGGSLAYSVLGLVIFAGLIMVDFQRLRRSTDLDSAPLLAASIFLDALNVFLFFLRLFSRNRD